MSGTAPGNITVNDAVNGESYLVRVYAPDADGQQVLCCTDGVRPVVFLLEALPGEACPAEE